LPTEAEGSEIRAVLGIPKRVQFSEQILAAKRSQMSMVTGKMGVPAQQ
jgi:hypothetical protein